MKHVVIDIVSCVFSFAGYYFIYKNPIYSYIAFILLNIVLFISTKQIVLLLNILFSTYFLIKIITK